MESLGEDIIVDETSVDREQAHEEDDVPSATILSLTRLG
jgi:hypothetical protein